jgi:hypothetical protein
MNSISPKLLTVTLTYNKTLNSVNIKVKGNSFKWGQRNEIIICHSQVQSGTMKATGQMEFLSIKNWSLELASVGNDTLVRTGFC